MAAGADSEAEEPKVRRKGLADITAMLVRMAADAAIYALGFILLANLYLALPISGETNALDADVLQNLPLFVFSGIPFAFVWFLLAGLLSYGLVQLLATRREISVSTHVLINLAFLILLSHLVFLWSDTDYKLMHSVIYHLPAAALHFWPWTRQGMLLTREVGD